MSPKQKRDVTILLTALVMSALLMLSLAASVPTDAEMIIMAHAKEQGVTLQAYPQSLIALLERNPETEEFVLNYPFRQELETDLSSYDLSLGVPLLMQWDPRWGYMEYGSDMVAVTGSGPLCLAMAGYYVTRDAGFYPDAVVEFALAHDYASPGSGSRWSLISQGGRELGLEIRELAPEEKKIAAYLNAGSPIIAVMGPGDFTATSHFVVLTGYADGKLSVNDPNSYVNSGKLWDYDAVRDQFRNLWVILKEAQG